MKNAIVLFVSVLISYSCIAQRDPIAVAINSTVDGKINGELRSYFSDLFMENGFPVVERKQVDLLFLEYEDQKREDYFDGETIKVKLEGARYYCFVDIIESGDKLKVYYFLTDIFQERILFSDELAFSAKNELLPQFNTYSERIVSLINSNIPLNLYFYSSSGSQELKLMIEKSNLGIGSKVYGMQNEIKVCEFEITENLTSNMVQCKLIYFNKKDYGKSKDFDFPSLNYQVGIVELKTKKPVIEVDNSCLEKLNNIDLIVGVNKEALVVDILHQERLRFEQDLQRNELFMDGKSYFTLKQGTEFGYLVNVIKENESCVYTITQNNMNIAEDKFTSVSSLLEKIYIIIKKE
tara:strand:+ start:231 stop:1283 length:1053 start_codon:yes stop_codon:yes gene_type:complete